MIFAPSLIQYEFINQIRKFSKDIQEICLEIFDSLSINIFENISKSNILCICGKYKLTGYDSKYIDVLEKCDEKTNFLTFNKDFIAVNDSRIVVLPF
jgi:hypothetical protein